MSKNVLIATEKPFSPEARDRIVSTLGDAGYKGVALEKYSGKGALVEAITNVDAVIVRSDIIDKEVLDAARQLKLVVRAGAGYDNVDCKEAKSKNIAVMNTPGQNANAVAELAFGLMIYAARDKFSGGSGTELRDKTLGIHAIGAVGRAVAKIAQGFGMHVFAYDPFVTAEVIAQAGAKPVKTAEDLYRQSQYVSLHIPATSETKNSIGKALLGLLPKNGTLINTARKEVINESELLEVLSDRADIRYMTDIGPSEATLNVLKEKHAKQFYMTPKKMGAQTAEANLNAGIAAAHQIVGFFERGERQFVVN